MPLPADCMLRQPPFLKCTTLSVEDVWNGEERPPNRYKSSLLFEKAAAAENTKLSRPSDTCTPPITMTLSACYAKGKRRDVSKVVFQIKTRWKTHIMDRRL